MKKTFFSTLLFIFFLFSVSILYLSFFGYETDRFNKVIKSEIDKSNYNIELNFKKISILLDIKKLILFVKFVDPKLKYNNTSIPLKSLRTNVDLEILKKRQIRIKEVIISTEYLDYNNIISLINFKNLNKKNLKKIKTGLFQIKDLKLEFDKNFQLKRDFIVKGDVKSANIELSNSYQVTNLITNFSFQKETLKLSDASWNLGNSKNSLNNFFDGKLIAKFVNDNYFFDLIFKTSKPSILPRIPIINYSFEDDNKAEVKTKFVIKKNKNILIETLELYNKNNNFFVKALSLDKRYNLISFDEISVNTSVNNITNNKFKIIKKNKIHISGDIFDAKLLIKELSKQGEKSKFLDRISKNIEVDFKKIIKGAKFPIKNFRLVGKIYKGSLEKISAKSDFDDSKHLDISLNKDEKSNLKILEIYSDIAMPLLNDYKFFQGLDGGNLVYLSKFNNITSSSTLKLNNFKLNKAPALAKLLSLADFKGLTDTLKGEGISFDTLVLKYESDPITINITEIFMVGPSISILIDGYVEKKSGLVSLRGTMVPAKTLNNIISKIPVVGDILIGQKIGEGIFGVSFKIKGPQNNLKTTVNPLKTLTPRFITRALESAKNKNTK